MLIITDLNDKEHPIQNGDYIKKDIKLDKNGNEKTSYWYLQQGEDDYSFEISEATFEKLKSLPEITEIIPE